MYRGSVRSPCGGRAVAVRGSSGACLNCASKVRLRGRDPARGTHEPSLLRQLLLKSLQCFRYLVSFCKTIVLENQVCVVAHSFDNNKSTYLLVTRALFNICVRGSFSQSARRGAVLYNTRRRGAGLGVLMWPGFRAWCYCLLYTSHRNDHLLLS